MLIQANFKLLTLEIWPLLVKSGHVDATGISIAGEYDGAYATGLKPGTVTVTAYVIDGFFRAPATLTYTINVVDPKASATPAQTSLVQPTLLIQLGCT